MLKANPGKYNYAHLGAGALSQMVMELFKQMAGVDIVGVPYKGSGQALGDIMGGQLPLMFDGVTSANTLVKAGRLKAFAVSSRQRVRFAPEVPPLADSGVGGAQGLRRAGWTGYSRRRRAKAILDRLQSEIGQILQSPEMKKSSSRRTSSLPADDAGNSPPT